MTVEGRWRGNTHMRPVLGGPIKNTKQKTLR